MTFQYSIPARENPPPGQMQVFQFVCGTCGRLIFESQARIARSPGITYIQCVGCGEVENRARIARRISKEAVCDKCGRVVNAFLDPGTDTVRRCSVCTRAERQPEERETFCPQDRVLSNGKRGARAAMGKRSMKGQDFVYYDDWREARNDDVEKLKDIYSPGFIDQSQRTLEDMSVRDMQKRWGIGCYESTRQGKIGILRLKPADLEIPPTPPAREIQHKMGRKCEHGMWKHRDDRQKSRYCSACNPNRFRMTPRSETKPKPWQEKRRVKSETERSIERLVDMDLPEEFGAIPQDPKTVVSQDVI